VGTVAGPLLGSVLVVGVQFWLSSYIERWPTVLGLLFIAVVILLPGGLASIATRRSKARRRGFHPAIRKVLAPFVRSTASDPTPTPSLGETRRNAPHDPLGTTPILGPGQHDERTP
jgi:branched-chain amino acid transport system permease protein